MKVLQYFPALRAGMGAYAESLVASLAETRGAGDSLHVATATGAWSDPARLERAREYAAVTEIGGDPRTGSPLRKVYELHLGQYRDVVRVADRLRPDVLHVHFGLYLTDWLLATRAPRHCRVVLTVHDPVPHRWLLPRSLRHLDRVALRWRYSRFDDFIVHSATGRDVLVDTLGVASERIAIIPHGSDIRKLEPLRQRPRKRVFAVLGGLRAKKRVVEVIEAYQRLPADLRAVWGLRVAGVPESPAYAAAIRSQVQHDATGVELTMGELSDLEFDDLLSSVGFVVLAYSDFASMSGLLLRAMAAGTVPIVALGSSLREQTPPALRVVSVGPSRSLGEALQEAARLFDSRSYAELQDGIVAWSRQYDWADVAALHWTVFRRIVGGESHLPRPPALAGSAGAAPLMGR